MAIFPESTYRQQDDGCRDEDGCYDKAYPQIFVVDHGSAQGSEEEYYGVDNVSHCISKLCDLGEETERKKAQAEYGQLRLYIVDRSSVCESRSIHRYERGYRRCYVALPLGASEDDSYICACKHDKEAEHVYHGSALTEDRGHKSHSRVVAYSGENSRYLCCRLLLREAHTNGTYDIGRADRKIHHVAAQCRDSTYECREHEAVGTEP